MNECIWEFYEAEYINTPVMQEWSDPYIKTSCGEEKDILLSPEEDFSGYEFCPYCGKKLKWRK